MKKLIYIVSIAILLIIVSAIWIVYDNNTVKLTEYTITDDSIPKQFSGLKIIQISDLHDAEFGKDNSELINLIKKDNPDLVFFTGDMVDRRRVDFKKTKKLITKIAEISPCYYVIGNHEASLNIKSFIRDIRGMGVTVLKNESVEFEKNGEVINILGVCDPCIDDKSGNEDVIDCELIKCTENINGYKILLSHRPEMFGLYVDYGINLVFSGHAHGGQVRLPFIGGLYAPHQGKLPKYDSGIYEKENTKMIVSRGLGNSGFPIRINNRPEIVSVTLKNN